MFHVITGGSGSGKSAFAEQCVVQYYNAKNNKENTLYYIATMEPFGEESYKKIERHREMRAGKGFYTIECYRNLAKQEFLAQAKGSTILLECMSSLAANEFYGRVLTAGKAEEYMVNETVDELWAGVTHLQQMSDDLVIVTNEVCSEYAEVTEEMKFYKKIMGEINRKMAMDADKVTEVVYGIPVEVK